MIAAQSLVFPDEDGLGNLVIPKHSTLNLAVPIQCSKMRISNTNVTVVWRDEL